MSNFFLDLKSLYNHRIVYPKTLQIDEHIEISETNDYIYVELLPFDKVITNGRVQGVFRYNDLGRDNIICESQVLPINNISVKKITFIGFCCWGYFKENFILECADGTKEKAKAYFSDVSSPLSSALESNYKTENRLFLDGSKIFCELKFKSNKRYMYYYTTEFEEAKTVAKIIFPDNYFMHVFAITTEDQ